VKKVIKITELKLSIMNIAIDFDGTCVTHDFPIIGSDIGAVPVLRELTKAGHSLILFTMRSDSDTEKYLTDAVNWFKVNEIPLWGIQTNPEQNTWTSSPKAYAHLYIDDAALGCPLIYGLHARPYVDWKEVRNYLVQNRILKP
jgi:hypothetical protein